MSAMTPRLRLRMALGHQEPDRVPYDLASSQVTGISREAYRNLRKHLGMPLLEPKMLDVVQQVCIPDDDMMARLKVDVRGLYPLTSHNWNIHPRDDGTDWSYEDEWGLRLRMPKDGGRYYSIYGNPLGNGPLTREAVERHRWPDAGDPRRLAGLRAQAESLRARGFPVVLKGLCAGIFEMACRLRGMEQFLVDLLIEEAAAVHLLRKIAWLKICFWESALAELGGVVDVVAEGDDYGTQEAMLIRPEMFRRLFKPLLADIIRSIRGGLEDGFVFFHSCGSVRDIIPDFAEIGVDILNPVHVAAAGMNPAGLKRDFGNDLCFWGGGVDTQGVLPHGTPGQVRDDVRRNLDALAPGGGYVFNPIHNIQPDVPPENIMAHVGGASAVRRLLTRPARGGPARAGATHARFRGKCGSWRWLRAVKALDLRLRAPL